MAEVIKADSPTCIDVQPLTLTQQIGEKPKKQALLTKLSCLNNTWEYINIGSIVLCVVCERDITEARNGKSSIPSSGRHEMKNSIIIGTICGNDQLPIGYNSLVDKQDFQNDTTNKLFREAEKYLGMKYTFGGIPPRSFDCSSFVCWVFTNSGVRNTPHTTAQGLYNQCIKITDGDVKASDLVFFSKTYDTSRLVSHVGIYTGNNSMVHCGNTVEYTNLDNKYWKEHFLAFGRLG